MDFLFYTLTVDDAPSVEIFVCENLAIRLGYM